MGYTRHAGFFLCIISYRWLNSQFLIKQDYLLIGML